MKRVIMTLAAVFALALVAAPANAGEAEQQNATRFIESLEGLNDAVVGDQKLDLRILEHTLGSMTVNITKGDYQGTACYVIKHEGTFDLGNEGRMVGTTHLAADLSVLHSDEKEYTGETLDKHTLIENKAGIYHVTIKQPEADDETDREAKHELKSEPRLLLGGADMLLYMLLPRELKNYEFLALDDDTGKLAPRELSAKGAMDKFGRKAFRFQLTEIDYTEDELGDITEEEQESEIFVAEHRLVHMGSNKGFSLTTGPEPEHTRITREAIEKQDDAIAVAAGFFLGRSEKDADLLGALINEVAFVLDYLDNNPDTAGLPQDQKEALAEQYAPTVIPNMVKGEDQDADEAARSKAVTELILHRENFTVSEKDGVYTVKFTEKAQGFLGELTYTIKKNDEDKLEITKLASGEEEEEEGADEEAPEDSEGKEDDF